MHFPDKIELDGAKELLRCPNAELGWRAAEITIGFCVEFWHLPGSLNHLLNEWQQRHPAERSDPKVALRSAYIDQNNGSLICRLKATEWRDVRALHEGPRLDEDAVIRPQKNGYEMLLPNIGVVHVIACTRDRWLLAFRRSKLAHYHPGALSATYEEGLAPEDLGDNLAFQRAARRGVAEELTPQAVAMPLEAFRIISIVLEKPLGNPAVVIIADLPFSRVELSAQMRSDELDATSILPIPVDPIHLRRIITTRSISSFSGPGDEWHPTSRYRLLVAMAYLFGEAAAADTLAEAVSKK